ncbi:metal ABC transporter solute-binding protein, Zn/Mn family [Chromatium okenii]|uniref:metal ABC transporter solute-binding protein, Zn/Mn family n=1 Tax=Chromatium okenii TaxID=61644 RepID=UPI0026F36CA1|nr:zinc ABC transporter substrate-binding protein [Chromatium okenii]MBV5308222.1 zinc ABC transporter substrate-binding protein [Chromatium okenii]
MKKLCYLFLLFIPLAQSAEPLHIFVSVLPQQTFVERIGGSHVIAEALVKPGANPHTYEPTPSQIKRLANADLYIRIGIPFETAWLPRIQAANPQLKIIDARDGIALQRLAAHEDDAHDAANEKPAHDHASVELDPHLWTSPLLVKQMAVTMETALADIDSTHAADYRANLAAFTAELDVLDHEIRAELIGLRQRRFMVFHPAWGYFAAAYGLEQITIEHAGKEPSARQLVALIEQAQREAVHVILVQPQFSPKAAAQVAQAIDGKVESIDPLAADYFATLRRIARVLAETAASK